MSFDNLYDQLSNAVLNGFGIPASVLKETKPVYSSYDATLRLFEQLQVGFRKTFTSALGKVVEPLLRKDYEAYAEFIQLTRWTYRGVVVYARIKSEARAALKKRIGKLPVGAGKEIFKESK